MIEEKEVKGELELPPTGKDSFPLDINVSTSTINRIPSQFQRFNIIPLKPHSKKYNYKIAAPQPASEEDYKWEQYQNRMFPRKLLKNYKGNLGVVLGDPLNERQYLTQVDIDEPEFLKYFKDSNTLIIKTGRGYGVFILSKENTGIEKDYPIYGIEIRGSKGAYAVIPPSIHPKTKKEYSIYKDREILVVDNAIEWVKQQLKELSNKFKDNSGYYKNTKPKNTDPKLTDRKLDDETINEIVNLLKPYYKERFRNDIIFALSGLLKKEGIDIPTANKIFELITEGDEEKRNRYKVFKKTYEQENQKELKGISGIIEALENQNLSENKIKATVKAFNLLIRAPKKKEKKSEVKLDSFDDFLEKTKFKVEKLRHGQGYVPSLGLTYMGTFRGGVNGIFGISLKKPIRALHELNVIKSHLHQIFISVEVIQTPWQIEHWCK